MKLKEPHLNIIAVDFDGTIASCDEWPIIGEEIPGAIKTLQELQENGYKIILWTGRCGNELKDAIIWLESKNFKPDAINCNIIDTTGFGCVPKIFATWYIDDRILGGFPGWGYVHDVLIRDKEKERLINET